MKFSQELADDSPFNAREFIAGQDAVTLARDILALDQEQFSAALRKSPMKRAKLRGLKRNAAVVLKNVDTDESFPACRVLELTDDAGDAGGYRGMRRWFSTILSRQSFSTAKRDASGPDQKSRRDTASDQ